MQRYRTKQEKKCAMKCERYKFHIFYKKVQKKKPTVQSMVEAWIQTLSSICKVGNFYISSSEHRLHYEMKDIPDIV